MRWVVPAGALTLAPVPREGRGNYSQNRPEALEVGMWPEYDHVSSMPSPGNCRFPHPRFQVDQKGKT